jgi:hypothetical protein
MVIIEMNRSGDDRHEFKVDTDEAAVVAAMTKFNELIGAGKFASVPGPDGSSGRLIREFDPTAETIIFRNQIIGG